MMAWSTLSSSRTKCSRCQLLPLSWLLCVLPFRFLFTVHWFQVQIENNLDEWVTGELVAVAFSQSAYEQKYLAHVKHLKDFDEKTKESNIVTWLRKHLLKMVRYVSTKRERSPYLIYFTGSTPESTPQASSRNPRNSRKKISRLPRKNGRILFSLRVRTKCKSVLGLFLSINSFNYCTYICMRSSFRYFTPSVNCGEPDITL